MTMTCPVHGGSLATPCHCEMNLNDIRVLALLEPSEEETLPNPSWGVYIAETDLSTIENVHVQEPTPSSASM